ncbi:dicarboxylate/amino acid:cation symporter [Galactobacter caseinivorans]|uniref:Dicarboxylate/amino acid:cation symporter n=1 Tax=Galactobacter caseinivorans TaxID=2676123 RepID=A0A496PJJ8_9MICC|nr:dicarboxylate/amino acid:cation symporter [Galactobacter caseinivorans]RKW70682.1 dicarboxylate/amino acid:cation symporter [Galactobacter caseinivorans]
MTSTSSTPQKRRLPAWTGNFGYQILAGLVLGFVLGFVALQTGSTAENPNGLGETLQIVGSSYVKLLMAAVPPLIFFAVVASIANLAKVTNAARLAWKTIMWFAITALIAVLIGIALGVFTEPGKGTGQAKPEAYEGKTGDWLAFIQGLIPSNFLGLQAAVKTDSATGAMSASVSFNVLQILVISIAVGIAALKIGKKADGFVAFSRSALKVVQKVLWWIIRLAPLGTIGLLGNAVASYGWTTMGSLAKFVLVIYVGLALVTFVVYPVLVKMNGLSVKQYFSGVWPAVQLGFVSRSSMGTMPLTQRVTERNLGVPTGYASFAVPLGATTKMDGCAAIYPAIAAIFVAQFYGITLSPAQYVLIVVVSVLGSAATAGTTGATVMLTLTLSTLGLPLDGVGLLLAIDPIIDMGRTALNVAGQALVPTIVAKREGILDLDIYNSARTGDVFATVDEDEDEDAESPQRGEEVAAQR